LAVALGVYLILEATAVASFGGWRGFVVYADGHTDLAVYASLAGLLPCLAAALSRRSIAISFAWFVGTCVALYAAGKIAIALEQAAKFTVPHLSMIATLFTGLLMCFFSYRTGSPRKIHG
jgi:hypothetical protein